MLAYTPKTAITRNPPETNFIECLVSGLHCSVTHGPRDPARHVLFLHLTISFLLCSFRSIPIIDQPAVSIPDIDLSHGKDLVITLVAKTNPGKIVTERNKTVWAWKTNTWTCLPKNSNLFICFSYKKWTWNFVSNTKVNHWFKRQRMSSWWLKFYTWSSQVYGFRSNGRTSSGGGHIGDRPLPVASALVMVLP